MKPELTELYSALKPMLRELDEALQVEADAYARIGKVQALRMRGKATRADANAARGVWITARQRTRDLQARIAANDAARRKLLRSCSK